MTTIFDVEHLQQLAYERSTKWASFLENAKSIETMDEMLICEVESFYGPEFDERDTNDELASMEDSDCNEQDIDPSVLRNLTNNQRLSLLLSSTANTTTAEVETEIVDLVNETLPILHEHNRQLKETGFDKILSTFDKKKIEEKVGSWLNRHNSLFGGDANLLSDENKRKRNKIGHLVMQKENSRRIRSSRVPNSSNQEESYSSDDSLQSGEIARYIRSSRAASLKNTTSNTTMIKTYRLVKSKRDALREKYAFEKDNEKDCHLKASRHHCRRIANSLEYHHNHYDLLKKSHNHKHEMLAVTSSAYKQRRKILRKRLVTQSYDTTDSSDLDYYDECAEHVHRRKLPHFCNKYHCSLVRNSCSAVKVSSSTVKRSQRSALKMSSARLNRIYYFSPYTLSKSLSSSTSSSSFSRPHDSSCLVKMKRKCFTEQRPCKRESECNCRNEGKLCQDFLHITDTSTEEWYVENCGTPKKMVKDHAAHAKRNLLLGEQADNYSSDNENAQSISKRKIKMKTEGIVTSSITKQIEKTEKRKQKTNKIKNETETEKVEAEAEAKATTADESFDRELQKAIEMSKELFEKEQQTKAQESKNENRKTKGRPRTQNDDNITKEQKRIARKRKTNKKENNTNDEEEVIKKSLEMLQANGDHDNKHECEVLKPQSGQQINNHATEDTFFANGRTEVICNSTAMSPNSQAYKRQITNPSVEATEGLNRNEISKINEANITHEDNLEPKGVKNSTRKIKKNSKSTSHSQNQADESNSARAEKEENPRTTKRVKKSTRKTQITEQSNNFTSTVPGESQINDSRDISGSESSNKDNTVIFLKPTKEHKNGKITKSTSLQEQHTSKNSSQYGDRKLNKTTTSAKTNVSSTINCSNNSSAVTSTTIRSPDAASILIQSYAKNHSHAVLSDAADDDDDALVTSTTNIELPTLTADMLENMREQPTTSHQAHNNRLANVQHSSNKGILIYSPHNRNLSLAPSIASDGYFTITQEHLSSVIGEKAAEKFLKYYIGRKRFNSNSTIYYRPPMIRASHTNMSSSSDSDDELDSLGQYGDLYESLNKS